MEFEHCQVSNLHEKGLMLSILMGFLIGESKRYSISHICAHLEGVGKERVR